MTAHKHAAMIKAKADNVGLVQFIKLVNDWEVVNSHGEEVVIFNDHFQYFLCLPQNKEACLHWLNGGDTQYRHGVSQEWDSYGPIKTWTAGSIFMQENLDIRIKPRKEKRWIALNSFGDVMPVHCKDLESAKQLAKYKDVGINGEIQYIEIEIEV